MQLTSTQKFSKELKKLTKKYKTLSQDIEIFRKLIIKLLDVILVKSTNHHAILHRDDAQMVFVLKSRLQCRALKKSSLRVIYVYEKEKQLITFIEIYFKGDKQVEDETRWREFLRKN